jgi:putative ABC transport system permease protein
MSISSGIQIALRALQVNKLRSVLTMLGIIIGVGAVIAMVSIGSGATARIEDQIRSIGSNLLVVIPGSITENGIRLGAGAASTLTDDDATAIATECPAVAYAAPVVRGGVQVVFGSRNWATSLFGTTPSYLAIRDYTLQAGRPLTAEDVSEATNVALLGPTVVRKLFGYLNPLGKEIRIQSEAFDVVGVLSPKGQTPWGQDQDDVVIIPISTALERVLGENRARARAVGSILVQARNASDLSLAQHQVEMVLHQRHHILPGQQDDFTVRDLTAIFEAQEQSSRVMSLLLGAIASVSLLVGGIGIMNIMLVSVTERTREIGIRMAMGAKTRDILVQFLVEAVTLSIIGGVAGIAAGIGSSLLISRLVKWTTLISSGSVMLAFAFSVMIGIFFGYYPARKAAVQDPIQALRFE